MRTDRALHLPALTTVVVALVATVVILFAFAERVPCTRSVASPQGPALNWGGGIPFRDYCYSDVIALYGADHISDAGELPYRTTWIENPGTPAAERHAVEYPVLTGLFLFANAEISGLYADLHHDGVLGARAAVVPYFWLSAAWLAVAWLIVVALVARLAGGDLHPALLVAASPIVVAQLLTNFDAPAVALATGALWAWSRGKPTLAGLLIGLGAAAKLYPVLFLVPIVILCVRAGRARPATSAVAGAVVAWLAVDLPFAVQYPSGWSFFYRFSAMRGAGIESIWTIASHFTGWAGFDPNLAPTADPVTLNLVTALVLAAALIAVCLLALRAPVAPRLPSLCLLVVAAFLLTGKVDSPQYALWLVPLAALAYPGPWLVYGWMVIDALVWVPTMLYQRGAVSLTVFQSVVLLRDAALLLVCAQTVRHILVPATDPVRRRLGTDPSAGPLADATDRVSLGRLASAK